MSNAKFDSNTAKAGAAIYICESGDGVTNLEIEQTNFSSNEGDSAIFLGAGSCSGKGTSCTDNKVTTDLLTKVYHTKKVTQEGETTKVNVYDTCKFPSSDQSSSPHVCSITTKSV